MSSGKVEVTINDVSWRYTGAQQKVLQDISLDLHKGEIILIAGPNGAGKTTFCNLLNGLIPHFYAGELEGSVVVLGTDTQQTYVGALARHVGLLFQDPASQLVSGSVEDEVAFGLENVALPLEEIEKRTKFALEYVGLGGYEERPPFALSGGQQQALALACIMALNPEIYVLDEPTSNLDPFGTMQVFRLLDKIAAEQKRSFFVVEHKLEELIDVADHVIVLNEGRIAAQGPPREILGGKAEFLEEIGLRPPQLALLAYRLRALGIMSASDEIPLTLEEGIEVYSKLLKEGGLAEPLKKRGTSQGSPIPTKIDFDEPIITVRDLEFTYPTGAVALRGISFDIHRNEFIAIIGQNGSGKTTLVKHFNGLLRPTEGNVVVFGNNTRETPTYKLIEHVGYVFQNPDQQLFSKKVYEELAFGLGNIGMEKEQMDERILETAKQMNIEALIDERPYSLSKGDRQRVVISCILALNPEVIIVDEPTTGQDPRKRREIMELMKKLHSQGKTIVVITHDMNLAAEYAHRCIVMSDGKILLEGTPKDVFVQTSALAATHLSPPTVTQLFIRLSESYNVPQDLLTVDEAAEFFKKRFNLGGGEILGA